MLIAEMNHVFTDPVLFEDPLSFKPERFIDSNGKLVNSGLVIAFSVGEHVDYYVKVVASYLIFNVGYVLGKRNCPGEQFADVAAFLMFANILRKHKLSIHSLY